MPASSASSFSSSRVRPQNLVQRLRRVKLDVLVDAEPAAHRAGQQADTRRRADQRERLHGNRDRAGMRALVERHIHLEILHRRIQIFLDDGGEPVNLVDEQHIAASELRQDADQVGTLGQAGPLVT